jgi:hypothetical protein
MFLRQPSRSISFPSSTKGGGCFFPVVIGTLSGIAAVVLLVAVGLVLLRKWLMPVRKVKVPPSGAAPWRVCVPRACMTTETALAMVYRNSQLLMPSHPPLETLLPPERGSRRKGSCGPVGIAGKKIPRLAATYSAGVLDIFIFVWIGIRESAWIRLWIAMRQRFDGIAPSGSSLPGSQTGTGCFPRIVRRKRESPPWAVAICLLPGSPTITLLHTVPLAPGGSVSHTQNTLPLLRPPQTQG